MVMSVVLCEYANQIQGDEMMHTGFWWGNSKEREPPAMLTA
jgi:hypothetical protein